MKDKIFNTNNNKNNTNMKKENYVAPVVELISIMEKTPVCIINASGEDSNVSHESMDSNNI